ncbi:MAG: hypothetical protein B6I31_04520 [Desulfobacteraceae bacterium 4572_19]|nr:MAG: hypothetical protein B6I31_04520 [Desulfobacteraceae bacterium 4572_19]
MIMQNHQLQQGEKKILEDSLFLRTNSPADTQNTSLEDQETQLALLPMQIIHKEFGKITAIKNIKSYTPKAISKSKQFCTLAILIDNFSSITEKEHMHTILKNTGNTINAVCESNNGIWSWLSHNTAYCFFPDKTPQQGKDYALQINMQLSEKIKETVTTGIASYPMINFKKGQILENALKAIDHASFFGPGSTTLFNAVTLNISGDKFYQKGDIDNAGKEFERALLIDPENVNLHNSLGVCYGMTLDYKKALSEFEFAYKIDKKEIMALHNIGIIYDLQGDKKKALKYFSKALDIEDNIFEILFHAGRLYLEIGLHEKAVEYLEKAIKINSESGSAQRSLGKGYECINKIDKAAIAYKKAIKINPYDSDSLSALGHIFGVLNENAEIALVFCQQSVSLSPDNGLFRYRLGKAFINAGKKEEANAEFEKAKNLGYIFKAKTDNTKIKQTAKQKTKATTKVKPDHRLKQKTKATTKVKPDHR